MGRPKNKYIPLSEMCTRIEFCKIMGRGTRTFDTLKSQGIIIPCARDGRKFLYKRRDAEILRETRFIERF